MKGEPVEGSPFLLSLVHKCKLTIKSKLKINS